MMLKTRVETGAISLAILTCIVVFVYWFLHSPTKDLSMSLPGMDNRPALADGASENIKIGASFMNYTTQSSNLKGSWTRFRGADFDNINKEKIPLINSWGNGPDILWEVELGEGHAAPVIQNGKAYVLDYVEERNTDALRCFSLETGEELWSRWYLVKVKRNHGMSRTVPAITEKYLVTMGPRCHVMCVDPETGDLLWGKDLVKEYGTEIPFWYTGQCPIIVDDVVILAPGGSSLLIGVDCATGEVLWETPNPDKWQMSHSSIMPMTFEGKKMYVYFAVGGIVGISAEGPDIGKILWKTNAFAPNVIAPSPVMLGNGKFYATAGYGAGAALFQLKKTGDTYSVQHLQTYKPSEGIASEQQTPILYKGRMFSVAPKDAGGLRNEFLCVDPNNPKNILWTSGKTDRFGLGPYIMADNKFFILNDDGTLTIAKVNLNSFEFLDKAKIIDGQDAWGPFALADGYLLMRDSKKMVCINIRAKN
ncbi:MAG: PQQ-like beta-propeller repeat protein [Bacteroidetes bacterium]|nr:PQQ-like beta-propeller repeat protein [Bacteroidota bacterium]